MSIFLRTSALLVGLVVVASADPWGTQHRAVSAASVAVNVTGNVTMKPNRTLCSIKEKATLHVRAVTEFYASEFPDISWHHEWVSDRLWPSERTIAQWWAVYGNARCDGFIGPGWSAAAIAVSPLVDTLWLDPGSTTTELADKTRHHSFSRTIVSDLYAGPVVADVMSALGWRSCNMFFIDDTFGRSISEAFKQRWRELGHKLETVRTAPENLPVVNGTTDETAVADAIDALQTSASTVTFAVIRPWKGTGKVFSRRIAPFLNDSMMLFLEPTACDEVNDLNVQQLHYTLCLSYYHNRTVREAYLDYYATLNHTAFREELVRSETLPLGSEEQKDVDSIPSNEGYFGFFNIDSAYHMMSFMHAADDTDLTTTERIALLRNHTTAGLTGPISLDSNGDRQVAIMDVVNILPGNRRTTVGGIRDGAVAFTNGSSTVFYLKGQVSATVPSSEVPVPGPPTLSAMSLSIIIAASIFSAVVLVVCLLFLIYFVFREPPKDATHAPKPKSTAEPFIICFTDVEASGMLWARAPEFMGEALDRHNEIIRSLIKEHKGYEVKTIGDSFMVAFKDPQDAMRFALAVQDGLFADKAIGMHVEEAYKELDRERKRLLAHPVGAAYDALWHGLRVRIGLHYGGGEAKYSPASRSWDYIGQVVNVAARVEAMGHGGQVLVTSDLFDVLTDNEDALRNASVTEKGEVTINGNDTVRLYQVLPRHFERRDFPALRTEHVSEAATFGDVAVDTFPPALPGGADSDSTDGARSQQSAYAYMNNWDNREALATYLVRHHHLKVSPKMLLYQHHALVALMSTAKASQRTRTVETITRAWRVPVQFKIPPAQRKLRAAVDAMPREELQLMLVAARVVGSVGINLRDTPLLPTDDRDHVIALSTEMDQEQQTGAGRTDDDGLVALPVIPSVCFNQPLLSSPAPGLTAASSGGFGLPAAPPQGTALQGLPPPGLPAAQPQGLPPLSFSQFGALPLPHSTAAAPSTIDSILAEARQRTEALSDVVVADPSVTFPLPAATPAPGPVDGAVRDVAEPTTATQKPLPLPSDASA